MTGVRFPGRIDMAIVEAENTFGVDLDIISKSKSLVKFGRKDALGTTLSTIWEHSETHETYLSANDITHIVSGNAGDTSVATIEGHTIDGSGNFTFVVQTVTMTGQTGAALTTPLARVSRVYNAGGTAWLGEISVYEGGTTTLGIPDTDSEVHMVLLAGTQQSFKSATTISNVDFFLITDIYGSIEGKSANRADFFLEIRQKDGVFRPTFEFGLSGAATSTTHLYGQPVLIVPNNADIRMTAIANAAGTQVSASFAGYLASVVQP